MSHCCTTEEHAKILEIVRQFHESLPNAPGLRFRAGDTVKETTVEGLIGALEDNTELGQLFLETLRKAADSAGENVVVYARGLFNPIKVPRRKGCGASCGCGNQGSCGCDKGLCACSD